MDINVYLSEDLGQRAKNAQPKIEFSRLLQNAVEDELQRRDAVSTTLENTQTYEVQVEDEDGGLFPGRITGTEIAEDNDVTVYLTDDERVIAYDAGNLRYSVLGNEPRMSFEDELRDWLPNPAAFQQACKALGIKAVIDL